MHMYVFVNPTLRCLYTVLANPANVRHVHLLPWFYTVCTYAFVRFCQPYFTVYIYILIYWVGQNHIYTLYMTVYLVVSLPRIPYIHRIYTVLANPANVCHVHLLPWLVSSALLGLQVKGPKRGWEGDMQYVLALLSFKHHCRTLGH